MACLFFAHCVLVMAKLAFTLTDVSYMYLLVCVHHGVSAVWAL